MNTRNSSEFCVRVPIAQVSDKPHALASCTSEALYGEQITLLETHSQWGFVRQQHDGYEGFLKLDELRACPSDGLGLSTPTHWVSERSTLLFLQANIKSPVAHRIPFASKLSLTPIANSAFSQTACGFFVWTAHCLSIECKHTLEPIRLAKHMFLGMPYRWGGRSPEGADCSGLIQQLAHSQGISIPRDTGDQESFIQQQISASQYQPLDIVYWPGHTGILLDNSYLLHATAFTLSCIIEPLDEVIKRAGPISSVRRLFT